MIGQINDFPIYTLADKCVQSLGQKEINEFYNLYNPKLKHVKIDCSYHLVYLSNFRFQVRDIILMLQKSGIHSYDHLL